MYKHQYSGGKISSKNVYQIFICAQEKVLTTHKHHVRSGPHRKPVLKDDDVTVPDRRAATRPTTPMPRCGRSRPGRVCLLIAALHYFTKLKPALRKLRSRE